MITEKALKILAAGPFSRSDMTEAGLSANDIQALYKAGKIERVSRGVYQTPGSDITETEQFRIATLRIKGRSAICLLSALAYYDLTDSIPRKTWLMVDMEKRTTHKDIRLFRSRNPRWNIGLTQNSDFSITTIERTLVDSLIHRKMIGATTAINALKEAVRSKKVTLSAVNELGTKLGVEHRIYAYIESLS